MSKQIQKLKEQIKMQESEEIVQRKMFQWSREKSEGTSFRRKGYGFWNICGRIGGEIGDA